MGIDRIGKGGPTLPTNTTAEVGKSGQSFEATLAEKAGKSEKAGSVGAVEGTAASPLEKLRAGQIDLNGYLDLKLDQATAHLQGLAPAHLDAIKKALREQLATDPTLVDLVKGAAGQAPTLPEG
ncbi:hypothetical protein LZC95_44305 [Pendulispora brunnea]|uniref:Nascent polypeptide-associated complex subunit alpha-like UBA domain-containing protein n=1 Tax=Pendulispora brunnea TaxID=2905690 RepID=A0ABZ2K440_9BACT